MASGDVDEAPSERGPKRMHAVDTDVAISKTPESQTHGGMAKPSSPHSSCVDFDHVCIICLPLLSPQVVQRRMTDSYRVCPTRD